MNESADFEMEASGQEEAHRGARGKLRKARTPGKGTAKRDIDEEF